MAGKIVCTNCHEAEGPFNLFRHVGIVLKNGDVEEGNLDFPREDLIVCPSCGIAGSIEEFIREA